MIIDRFVENIEEVYQLSDVYIFPVKEEMNAIDIPLSVLEAASCNLQIVTTDYGELKVFKGEDGFFYTNDFNKESFNTCRG